jgi:hypothetical protein
MGHLQDGEAENLPVIAQFKKPEISESEMPMALTQVRDPRNPTTGQWCKWQGPKAQTPESNLREKCSPIQEEPEKELGLSPLSCSSCALSQSDSASPCWELFSTWLRTTLLRAVLNIVDPRTNLPGNTFTDMPKRSDLPVLKVSFNPVKLTLKINHHKGREWGLKQTHWLFLIILFKNKLYMTWVLLFSELHDSTINAITYFD